MRRLWWRTGRLRRIFKAVVFGVLVGGVLAMSTIALGATVAYSVQGAEDLSAQVPAADEPQPCGECHAETLVRLAGSAHAGLDCLGCHAAHGASSRTTDEWVAVCVSCHPDSTRRNTHPVGSRYRDPLTGEQLTCTSSCHDPHGSSSDFMVRQPYQEGIAEDGLCLSCHPDIGVTR